MRRFCIFYPPLGRKSGGTEVLLQVAGTSQILGVETVLGFWDDPDAGLKEELRIRELSWCPCSGLGLGPEDVWLVPDGWVNALTLGFNAKARTVLYCQNWAYLFDGLPEDVRWHDLPVEFVAVSHPVALFMEEVLGKCPPIIRPRIDKSLFFPPDHTLHTATIRMAYMPRKNSRLVKQVQRIIRERRPDLFQRMEWVSIQGRERSQVGEIMRTCHMFLATGFPEGCPLPPLEAMASGCLVAGYTGFGGWDYMRQARENTYSPPSFELRQVPWSGNGFFYPDGDVLGLAREVESAVARLLDGDEGLVSVMEAGVMTAGSYGKEQQEEDVRQWLKDMELC